MGLNVNVIVKEKREEEGEEEEGLIGIQNFIYYLEHRNILKKTSNSNLNF